MKPEDPPVTVSLECHVDYEKQPELVGIMKEVWGDKLVTAALHRNVVDAISDLVHHTHTQITPDDLKGRIFLMVCSSNLSASPLELELTKPRLTGRMVPREGDGRREGKRR